MPLSRDEEDRLLDLSDRVSSLIDEARIPNMSVIVLLTMIIHNMVKQHPNPQAVAKLLVTMIDEGLDELLKDNNP